MKTIYITLLVSSIACSAGEYANYIRESHFITGKPGETPHYEYHTDIENVDGAKGKLGVLNKTVYDLFVVETGNLSKEYSLDSKTVYTHAPSAELSIISDGPATSEPFTRADKPFYVTYTVQNLTPESDIADPRFNSVVLMSETSTKRLTLSTIDDNVQAKTVKYMPMPLMGGSDSTKVSGSINFTINENAEIDADEFASQEVKILPKHVGSLTGIDSSERYFKIPDATFNITNMYPDSTVRFYVYPDDNPSNETTIKNIPVSQELTNIKDSIITGLDEYIVTKGEWTLVAQLTETPWEDEIIDQISFTKVTNLKVRGNINTQN
ncbi:MAG: hypothetical protein ABGY95_11040 [Rubritalea sp.]|uniref:hypothetical protein n=1 Tax=Rubritalea sp. TaxID=2109375 RepID=UPI003241DDE7